jgi:hypothetical protein
MHARYALYRLSRRTAQRGQAFIISALLLVVGVSALIYTLIGSTRTTIENDRKTADALAQARDALIGRAASDTTRPGSLPCPDIDNDGDAESPVAYGGACPSYIGRFPWKTLSVPEPRDGGGERLWYALSPSFRDHSSGGALNSDTPGELTIIGAAPASNVIAIVFAPGPALGSQVRDAANQNNVANYLEGENATTGDNVFVTAPTSSTFNDKLLIITSDALFSVAGMRVAREVSAALYKYYKRTGVFPSANQYSDNTYKCHPTTYDGRIPLNITVGCAVPPANFADWAPGELPPWFVPNNWNLVVHYAVSSWCASTNASDISQCSSAGGLTVTGVTTKGRALIIAAGRCLGAQVRPCLDDVENANGDTLFVLPVRSALNNDRLLLVSEAP